MSAMNCELEARPINEVIDIYSSIRFSNGVDICPVILDDYFGIEIYDYASKKIQFIEISQFLKNYPKTSHKDSI